MIKKTEQVSDYNDVIATVSTYVEALRVGSVDMLDATFHADSVTYGFVNDELVGGTGNPTSMFIEAHGKSPDIDGHVDVLDMTPVTAVVRLITEKDAIGTDCCEYLTLVKSGQGWRIISKAFIQFGQ